MSLLFDQHLGIAYKRGILQANTVKAVDYLADIFTRHDDIREEADAYLAKTKNPALLERDFITRTNRSFIEAAMKKRNANG